MKRVLFLFAIAACGDLPSSDRPPVLDTPRSSIALSVQEGDSLTIDASASDPDGGSVTYVASAPAHGALSGSGPTFTYTPVENYAGPDSFTITISDGTLSLAVPVSITVGATNDAPVASDRTASTNERQGVAIQLQASDVDNPVLFYKIVAGAAHGKLTGVMPNLTYTPTGHYFGPDSFKYVATDGSLESNVATVTITVADVLTCGDGVVEGAEQCDDANSDDSDGCLSNCMRATCGDGVVRAGVEQCDDGNGDDSDGCLSSCAVATCGDGVVRAGVEECDDGNTSNADGCLNSCASATCGDGFTRTGVELCDDGNQDDSDACLNSCTVATCGDGVVQAGVEACDDGNAVDTDACLTTCVSATCGDGFVRAGVEACDDGNQVDSDACRNSCAIAACGDGVVHAGVEQCDDGNATDTDACRNTCAAASCGDGVTHAGVEQCDDGNLSNGDACTNACASAACGDGFVQAGEQCDDGNGIDTDACTTACTAAACGDGFVQAGEQCDDGNQIDSDACQNDCTVAVCGNGVRSGTEECDDGNTADGDGCGHSCRTERCGDGLVQFGLGEQCDDGNAIDGDGCSATCQADPFVTTGLIKISADLTCTTSVANSARKIAVDGSGVIHAVMQCGTSAHVVTSSTRGTSYTAPLDLSAALPNAPVDIAQVAISSGPNGVAYAAMVITTGEVYLRTTVDAGATWGAAVLIGQATNPSSGLSLQSFNDDIYVGFATAGGVVVARNRTRGTGTFELTTVAMSIAFFDLVHDPVSNILIVAADTPAFHIRASSDGGATFGAETNPAGQAFFSDWAFGNGKIYVSGTNLGAQGSATELFIISTADLTTSTSVTGLPAVTTASSRTLAADHGGNAFVASQLNGGGVQLDRLANGATAFDAPRLVSATGSSPIAAPLPGSQGAALIFTDGTSVFATVQAY